MTYHLRYARRKERWSCLRLVSVRENRILLQQEVTEGLDSCIHEYGPPISLLCRCSLLHCCDVYYDY